KGDGAPVICRAVSLQGTEGGSDVGSEAFGVVSEMERLNREEDVPFGNMSILLRKNALSKNYEEALEKAGIAVSNNTSQNPLDSPEVVLAVSLLNVVNNPSNDVHVAAVMCSPLYGFTFTDLLRLRTPFSRGKGLFERTKLYPETSGADPELAEKCRFFVKKIESFGKWSSLPVGDLLWNLYTDTGLLSVGSLRTSDAEGKKSNLVAFHDFAVRFESGRYRGLYNFVDHVNRMIDEKDALKQKYSPADCVSIMTAHTSKGLGMDVVFLAALGKSLKGNGSDRCFIDGHGLLFSRLTDREDYTDKSQFIYKCISEVNKEKNLSEELRLLYVMLTRAKKRLYLYVTDGAEGKLEKKLETNRQIIAAVRDADSAKIRLLKNAKSYAEMISIVCPDVIKFEKYVPHKNRKEADPDPAADSALVSELRGRMLSGEPLTDPVQLPTKLAVTSLAAGMFGDDEDAAQPFYAADISTPEFVKEGQTRRNAAEKGSATHAFMQFCDFGNLSENGFENELARQSDAGFISRESAPLVDGDVVSAFVRSPLFGILLSTPPERIWREYRFFVFLPAEDFVGEDKKERKKLLAGRDVLVQGAIDLLIENEDGSLDIIDYKTDSRMKGETDAALAARLRDRHGDQLNYYRRAAEEVFRKPVRRMVIYSFALGGEIGIERFTVPGRI
ncbi:MAG: PD-(D/E)XK nuclease family protein, partial [Clostridia bacterium]|nr:PD-(D/E)XK nuclease family protein [Clostridia bacterium]